MLCLFGCGLGLVGLGGGVVVCVFFGGVLGLFGGFGGGGWGGGGGGIGGG